MTLTEAGTKALEKIRSGIAAGQPDDGTLIAAILEAIAEKGISAADLDSFKARI